MFDEFLKSCPMDDEIKPSKKRIGKNISALKSLIETEEHTAAKRRAVSRPLIIAAVITTFVMASLFTVNAAMHGALVRFILGNKEIEGEYYDYTDSEGFRHISLSAVLPIDENNFAIIYDVDAPQEENMRVITDETDPEFMEKLRRYWKALRSYDNANAADFGLVFKDSEFCTYRIADATGSLGGTKSGKIKIWGYCEEYTYDEPNGTKLFKESFYYYVGQD